MDFRSISRRNLLLTGAASAAAIAFPRLLRAAESKKRKLILIAGKPSHPAGMHEFSAGIHLAHKWLKDYPGLEVSAHYNYWVADEKVFEDADAVLVYSDGGKGHPILQGNHKQTIAKLMSRGVGLMCAHFAVEVPKDDAGAEFQDWIGGYYEDKFSCNPLWEPDYQTFPDHPIARGVKPFKVKDEWYFNIRFRPEMKGVTSILQATPPDAVRDGPYVYPKGPYPHVQANKGKPETMMWAFERENGGRGVGFTGGHYHTNWSNPNFRKVFLNALLWISKVEVPTNGIETAVTDEEMLQNLDPKPAPKK